LDERTFQYLPNFLLSFDPIFYLNLRARDGGPPTVQAIAKYFEFAEKNVESNRAGVPVDFAGLYRNLILAPAREIQFQSRRDRAIFSARWPKSRSG
jgi:hypothetical protein